MTLAEFLLARIAEDATAEVHDLAVCTWANDTTSGAPCDCGMPARILAECEAKRFIIGWAANVETWGEDQWAILGPFGLALPYADHPDFRQEWRP